MFIADQMNKVDENIMQTHQKFKLVHLSNHQTLLSAITKFNQNSVDLPNIFLLDETIVMLDMQ